MSSIEILATLAVLGTGSHEELSALGLTGLGPAHSAGLLRDCGGQLSAAHPVLAGAALERLGVDRTRDLHRVIHDRAADITTRATHLDRATEAGPDEILAGLLHEAGLHSAGATAVSLLRRSIERSLPGSERLLDRQLALAEALFAQGELLESTGILQQINFDGLSIERLDTALPLALMAFSAANGDAETEVFLRRLHAHSAGDAVRSAVLSAYLAEAELDPAERREIATDALNRLRAAGAAPLTRHRAIGSLVTANLDAGLGLDPVLLREAKELEEQVAAVALNDSADGQTALYSYQAGDLESSRRALEVVRSRAADSEELLMAGIFGVHLAAVHVFAGRMDAATAVLADAGELVAFTSPPPSVVAARGLVLLRQVDEAPLRDLVAQPHLHGSEVAGAVTRAALSGIAAARRQRWEEAVHELSRARRLSRAAGVEEPGRRLWVDFALARTYIQLGRIAEALEIRDTLAALSHGTRPLLEGVVARLDGLIAAHDGRVTDSLALLRQSVGLLTSAGFPTEVALSLLDLGRTLHAARLRAEADETLARAAEIALAAGDEQLASIIALAKEQTRATSTTSVLSEREQIVAEDAARGRTNREIAETHFLSVRTVETQLSSAYRKLGVRSRSELTALLARETASA